MPRLGCYEVPQTTRFGDRRHGRSHLGTVNEATTLWFMEHNALYARPRSRELLGGTTERERREMRKAVA